MKFVKDKISLNELKKIAKAMFGDLVKAVVDINRGIMVVGGELHADEEALLLKQGSAQKDLWGINIYPNMPENKMVEFDSMINIRPRQNNRSRDVLDEKIREKIISAVNNLIES